MQPVQKAWLIFAFTLGYAVLRYNVFGDVSWNNVPVFVLNKALSWTGLLLFGLSVLVREKPDRRLYGILAILAILAHTILSLMILEPAYFGKFYLDSGRLRWTAELAMLAGVVGFLFLAGLFYCNGQATSQSGTSLRAGWGRAVLWCTAVHVAAMGYAGWLTPATWHGYLPPITLLSFVAVVVFLGLRAARA